MKVALIIPSNLHETPYVYIYANLLNEMGVSYDIISWNRKGKVEDSAIQFNFREIRKFPLRQLWGYYQFSRFVEKQIVNNKYDRLVVFTSQCAIFLRAFLKRNYHNKYIFDFRDLSIEQKPYFGKLLIQVLRNSYANVVSSPGFIQYLPKGFDYLLSHNFDVSEVLKALHNDCVPDIKNTSNIDVLTIGQIRDFESNFDVMSHLVNIAGFSLRFVGKGASSESLRKEATLLNATNVSFEGYYPKVKEKDYIKEATFINIYLPRKPSHDSTLSNRLYNALIYKRPIIATKNTIHGDLVEKYGIGVSIDDCENLPKILKEYVDTINPNSFNDNCNKLLHTFLSDYEIWKREIVQFMNNN